MTESGEGAGGVGGRRGEKGRNFSLGNKTQFLCRWGDDIVVFFSRRVLSLADVTTTLCIQQPRCPACLEWNAYNSPG